MPINFKAAVIGGVVFWILALLFGYAGGLAGWGNVIAALIGGFIGTWQAKDKKPVAGATTGAIAGIIGAIIAIILTFAGLSYGGWPIALGGVYIEMIVWGLIFAAIGGVISPMVMKK